MTTLRTAALCALLAAGAARGDVLHNGAAIDLYAGDTRLCDVIPGGSNTPILSVGTPPSITRWAVTPKTTFLSTEAKDVFLHWGTTGATELEIRQGANVIGDVTGGAVAAGSQAYTVPGGCGSAGCEFTLYAENTAATGCSRDATAKVRVRVVTAPAIASFTASAPASAQGPFLFEQCATLAWAATAGDPPAQWSFSQTGFGLAHLPSDRNAAPGRGPQRVCTTQRPGRSTTITLTGHNEAGTAARSVTIAWAGGQ